MQLLEKSVQPCYILPAHWYAIRIHQITGYGKLILIQLEEDISAQLKWCLMSLTWMPVFMFSLFKIALACFFALFFWSLVGSSLSNMYFTAAQVNAVARAMRKRNANLDSSI